MNWDAISAVGEIVGAAAVVVTLIYLAIQVKDSAKASRSAAITDATTAMQAFYHELGSNQQACGIWLEGMTNPDAMSKQDQLQFVMLCHSAFVGFQRSFFLVHEGTLDQSLLDSIGTAVVAVKDLPGMDFYWRQRKDFFQKEFIEWVELLMTRDPLKELKIYRSW